MGNIILSFEEATEKINKFLKSTKRVCKIRFKEGCFITLKKHTKKGKEFLEIHTSGYDDTLEINEALEWIKWELYDLVSNGVLRRN